MKAPLPLDYGWCLFFWRLDMRGLLMLGRVLSPFLSFRISVVIPAGLLLLSGCVLPTFLYGQAGAGFTRIYGPQDADVSIPQLALPLGRQDAGALQELAEYRKVINVSSWKGMQASGSFTNASGVSSPASFAVLGDDHFRLDVQISNKTRSTRIGGSRGQISEANGRNYVLTAETARAGLLAFPHLLVAGFPDSNTSFIDRGDIQIGGQTLHLITEFLNEIAITDLYFDTSSHLLVRSASNAQIDSLDRQRYLVVTTYSGYQNIGDSLLPLTYSQTINGQTQWTLQLSSPDLQPSVDNTYFHF
jgi:hypothetical protein